MKNQIRAFGAILIFLLMLFSYRYAKAEINDLATNATLTNNLYVMLNATFGILWVSIAFLMLIIAFYFGYQEL